MEAGLLVERDVEVVTLCDIFIRSKQSRGQVALIGGGLGTGKTALLHKIAERAVDAGFLLLLASGARVEQNIAGGVLTQLFQCAALPDDIAERVQDLLDDDALLASSGTPIEHASAHVVRVFCAALLDLAATVPIAICVDDLQFADELSLHALSYLQRRMRTARVLMVLTEWTRPRPAHAAFSAQITRQLNVSRIVLGPLSRAGVATLLDDRFGRAVADRLAPLCHRVSGGNPVLVHALIDDLARDDASPDAMLGPAFCTAMVSCLHRWDPALLEIAQGAAVLGAATRPSILGELVGTDCDTAAECLRILDQAGILDNGRFRHAVARESVLDSLSPPSRATLHLRAARLLHAAGAPPAEVAGLLLAVERPNEAWAADVLRDAARQAATDNDVDLAVRCLTVASRVAEDDRDRAEILSELARVEWRRDPSVAARYLAQLQQALAKNNLADRNAITLIRHLLWHGRFDEVAAMFTKLAGQEEPGEAQIGPEQIGPEVHIAYQWLSHMYPSTFDAPQAATVPGGRPGAASDTWVRISVRFHSAIAEGRRDEVINSAEYVLQTCRLDDANLEALLSALLALVWFERCDRASQWCVGLLDEAAAQGADTWSALLGSVQAEILLRRGDLPAAAECADRARRLLPPRGWGVAVGSPLSTSVIAATAMGNHAAAEELLRGPVPNTIVRTRSGVQYLHARGRFHLAKNHLQAALADFQHCGQLLAGWGMDLPALLSWRTDAATAYRRLGRRDLARALIEEQLTMPTGDLARGRGLALRVLASVTTSEPNRRISLLHESVELLQGCGDRYEMATSLVDLSTAQRAAGDLDRARASSRRALQVAKSCKAGSLIRARWPDAVPAAPTRGAATLSDAERRVAALAAQGHANREVGRQLHITVSTVEQHLTRVYRKLNVRNRSELAAALRVLAVK